MTPQHLESIPETAHDTYLAVLDAARAAAEVDVDEPGRAFYRAAEARHPVPRTGTKSARIAAAGGSTAAHALRIQATERAREHDEPWTDALAATGSVLSSWDWDERMRAALDLRTSFKDLPKPAADTPSIRPARLVAAWLTHTNDAGLIPAGTRLAEHTLSEHPDHETWATAWYSVNALTLLDTLTAEGATTAGRPGQQEAVLRTRLRAAVVGSHRARLATVRHVAARAGITRQTHSSWTKHLREDA